MTQEFDRVDPLGSPPASDTVAKVVRSHPDTRQKKQFEVALKKKLEEEKKKQEERLRQDKVELGPFADEKNEQQEKQAAEPEKQPEPTRPIDHSRDEADGLDIKA